MLPASERRFFERLEHTLRATGWQRQPSYPESSPLVRFAHPTGWSLTVRADDQAGRQPELVRHQRFWRLSQGEGNRDQGSRFTVYRGRWWRERLLADIETAATSILDPDDGERKGRLTPS